MVDNHYIRYMGVRECTKPILVIFNTSIQWRQKKMLLSFHKDILQNKRYFRYKFSYRHWGPHVRYMWPWKGVGSFDFHSHHFQVKSDTIRALLRYIVVIIKVHSFIPIALFMYHLLIVKWKNPVEVHILLYRK